MCSGAMPGKFLGIVSQDPSDMLTDYALSPKLVTC